MMKKQYARLIFQAKENSRGKFLKQRRKGAEGEINRETRQILEQKFRVFRVFRGW
jgi:hypothetical protein